jgi:hypothetical protein
MSETPVIPQVSVDVAESMYAQLIRNTGVTTSQAQEWANKAQPGFASFILETWREDLIESGTPPAIAQLLSASALSGIFFFAKCVEAQKEANELKEMFE